MKTLKKVTVAFVLFAIMGVGFVSCSEDTYYEEPIQPLPPTVENPISVVPDPF